MFDNPITHDRYEYEDLVLIIDDVEENLILLKRILVRDGYRVESIVNSTMAIKAAQELQPSLILMDIQMPGLDGFDVCKLLKSDPVTCSIPIIFISALESTADRLRGFEIGAVDYIVKPIEIDETRARVKSHITIRRLQQQLFEVNKTLDGRVAELTSTQIQLGERERRLNALINALPTLTFVYDETGKYLEIMGNKVELFVQDPSEMLGKNIRDVLPPDVASMLLQSIQTVLQTNQTKVIEYQLTLRNRKTLWFEGRLALLEHGGDGSGKVICVTSEVTQRVELYKQVETLAIQDPLTNCFNRRHFLSLAQIEIGRAHRFNRSLSLLMVDVDHFKLVNDEYGHPVGDQVLRGLVETIRSSIRNIDILGRFGGEEFILMLPETDIQGAIDIAERLRQTIEKSGISTNVGVIPLTISIGLVCLDSLRNAECSIDEFISEVDKALYQAKMNGRNQVHTNSQGIPVRVPEGARIRKL